MREQTQHNQQCSSCLLSMPKVRAPRNVKIRGFQKQKATRLEFPTSVRLEGIRPPCPKLLWIGSSRNPANSSSTSQMHGFCWGSLSSSRLQQQHLASHMSTEVHINERVTTQLEHWQTISLSCETGHESPVENPAPALPGQKNCQSQTSMEQCSLRYTS